MVISNKLKYTKDIHRMTGCLDQLSYWASIWWECFSQNAENHEIFGKTVLEFSGQNVFATFLWFD